ncbi:hypothetical protein [Marinomonas rhodophyticola]|uniref:Uncharacterized protein n=1 Tax=Marinomonas rhodophyticola TaxID=2992803 RepID=A0ABT3KCF4_9GAMM|nr:hypothetical protein [Marinomonas sp. KJ51-3]MCW4628193.1 hypothetical protein [Marinomonas sp. KJ51-3]
MWHKHFDTTPAFNKPNNEKGRQLLGGLSGFAGHDVIELLFRHPNAVAATLFGLIQGGVCLLE